MLVIGATYAHFTYINVSRVSPKVEVGAATLNFITFEIGDPIFINPTIENFKEGMKNLSSDTFASAYLRVENSEEETQDAAPQDTMEETVEVPAVKIL